MADGFRNPRTAPMSPKAPSLPPKGTASDKEKAVFHTRRSGDFLIPDPKGQQARNSHFKNVPLVANRPVDPAELVKAKQRVTLVWKKQKGTSATQATYFDNLDGVHNLLFERIHAHYEAVVELTCGEHSGCLALGGSDLGGDIQAFHVPPLPAGNLPIIITLAKADKLCMSTSVRGNKVTTSKENKGVKRDEEELQQIRESIRKGEGELQIIKDLRRKEEEEGQRIKEIRKKEEEKQQKTKDKLEVEIRALYLILEKNKKQVASFQQLNEYKREIEELKQQVKEEISGKNKVIGELAGHRNEEKIRDLTMKSQLKKQTETDTNEVNMQTFWNQLDATQTSPQKRTPVRSKDYVNLETSNQRNEYYIEYKELEKSKENLCKAKLESEFNTSKLIDYLHSEKIILMDELTRTKRELAESNDQIAKLKENIREAPPLPARSSAPLSPRYTPIPSPLPPGNTTNPRYRS